MASKLPSLPALLPNENLCLEEEPSDVSGEGMVLDLLVLGNTILPYHDPVGRDNIAKETFQKREGSCAKSCLAGVRKRRGFGATLTARVDAIARGINLMATPGGAMVSIAPAVRSLEKGGP